MGEGKVIHLFDRFPNKSDNDPNAFIVKYLEDMLASAKRGELKKLVIGCERTDGEYATGYCNCDLYERQTLVACMQSDIVLKNVEVNLPYLLQRMEE